MELLSTENENKRSCYDYMNESFWLQSAVLVLVLSALHSRVLSELHSMKV